MKTLKRELILRYSILILLIIVSLAVIIIFSSTNKMLVLSNTIMETKLDANIKVMEELISQNYGHLTLKEDSLFTEDGENLRDNYELVDKMAALTSDVYTILWQVAMISKELQLILSNKMASVQLVLCLVQIVKLTLACWLKSCILVRPIFWAKAI